MQTANDDSYINYIFCGPFDVCVNMFSCCHLYYILKDLAFCLIFCLKSFLNPAFGTVLHYSKKVYTTLFYILKKAPRENEKKAPREKEKKLQVIGKIKTIIFIKLDYCS